VGILRNVATARSWVLAAVILAHAGVLYELIHSRARATLDGPPMFGPAIANKAPVREALPIASRPWQTPVTERSIDHVRAWHFPRVDIWPVTGEGCPTPTDTGPLMDAHPVAEEEQTQLDRAPAQLASIPNSQKPRMVVWLRPSYTLDWARTEMEGTVRLALRISAIGNTDQMQIEQSSGSQKLDATAVEAAKSWRFKPANWQGRSVDSKVTVELNFRFFEYSASRIDDQEIAKVPRRNAKTVAHPDRNDAARRLMEQLRPAWPPAMRDWGPIAAVQDLGTIGGPEWRRYNIKSQFRTAGHANSVVVRWKLYRVAHDNHSALWEVGEDRTGAVWAAKAESLDALDRTNGSATVCPGDNASRH
jgi:TonB family protein